MALNRQEQKAKEDYEVAIAAHQGNLAKRKAFDSKTGKPMESSDVQKRLNEHFQTLHSIADEAKLSQGSHDRHAKAASGRRVPSVQLMC